MLDDLTQLFERDLKKIISQIALYENENDLWIKGPGISNSAGNLTLHIIGNLNHFIGAILGKTSYIRDRNFEFGDVPVPRDTLSQDLGDTITMIKTTLSQINETQLNSEYPIVVFSSPMTTSFFLMHLHAHLNYHLGQINYHRRILTPRQS